MRLRRPRRLPVVLLCGLVATLVFPRACDQTLVAVGGWLPSAASPAAKPDAVPAEEQAALVSRVAQLEAMRSALPTASGPLAGTRIEHPARGRPSGVVAGVLRRDLAPTRRTFLVDVGRNAGVQPGQPVIHGDSLVGIVLTASAGASRVLRIDDRSVLASFPVAIVAASAGEGETLRGQGIARGAGDGGFRVTMLPQGGARPGDFVVTAAGGKLVPEGLVVGLVTAIGDEDRDGAWEARGAPLRPLDELQWVTILLAEGPGLGGDAR